MGQDFEPHKLEGPEGKHVQVKAEAEKKKLRAGRMLLAGLSLGEEESEQLEGMSPQVGNS